MGFGGLFSLSESSLKESSDGKFYGCFSCGLHVKDETNKVSPYGSFGKEILIINESPSKRDVYAGRPWEGQSGRLLKNNLNDLGIDLYKDCITINAVECLPVDSTDAVRTPTGIEIKSCRKNVFRYVEKYKPKLVILFGPVALLSYIGSRWKKGKFDMNKWDGWIIPDQEYDTWVIPLHSPMFLLKYEKYKEVQVIWKNNLRKALAKLDKKVPKYQLTKKNVEVIDTEADIYRFLKLLYKQDLFVWDIETTGLKPHDTAKHKIHIISFCWDGSKAYSILMPEEEKSVKLLRKILASNKVKKIAHNMKYENMWAAVWLGVEVGGWFWDTMQATHILNNQPGVNSLKFQTYVRLGIPDYDTDVSPYLRAKDDKDGNAVNKLGELMNTPDGRMKAMLYCGYDSLNTYHLFQLQQKDFQDAKK